MAKPGSQTNHTPAQLHTARLKQIRQARRARRVRGFLLTLLAALLALFWFTGVYGSSIALLGDLWDSVRIGAASGPGFPQKTGLGEIYQAEELAGGFAALAQKDLVLYSAKGTQLRSIQHGYARPAIAVGGRRVCLYSRSGYEVRIESRSKTLYTKTFEQPVLFCAMSPGGSLAVVTRSARYAAELTVYSPGMEFRYGWNPTDAEGVPLRAAFAADNRRLAVACLSAREGQVCTGLYWLDIRSDQVTASALAPGSTLLQLHWLNADSVLAVYDDMAAVYDAATGQETARYSYGGRRLVSASVCGQMSALLLAGSAQRIAVLNAALEPAANIPAASSARQVVLTRTAAYSLESEAVRCYSLTGEEQWSQDLPNPPQALVQAQKLLLFSAGQVSELAPPDDTPAAANPAAPADAGGAAPSTPGSEPVSEPPGSAPLSEAPAG